MSPTIFRELGFRFFFFSREEPRIHVHVYCSQGEAKFWIEPEIELADTCRVIWFDGDSPESLADELKKHVAHKIGAIARPDDIIFAADLPKTRSGKIMRRLLRDIAEGKALGDTTTLADPAVVAKLKEQYESQE